MHGTAPVPHAAPWLFERLATYGDAIALVHHDRPVSYRTLLERVAAWDAELARRGIGPGSVVLLEGTTSAGAVGLLLALVRRGAITVPLTPQAPVARETIAAIAEAGWQASFTQTPDGDETATIVGAPRAVATPVLSRLATLGHPGLVLFSSGSTGTPKGVVHDCVALLEKFARPGKRKTTLSFLLFDHIGGVDTLFNTLSSGGTLVTIQSRDPDTVCAAIAAHRVHTLPTSPTFLNMLLLNGAHQRHDISSLRLVAYGTEPMPASVLARLGEAMPQVKLLQTYGPLGAWRPAHALTGRHAVGATDRRRIRNTDPGWSPVDTHADLDARLPECAGPVRRRRLVLYRGRRRGGWRLHAHPRAHQRPDQCRGPQGLSGGSRGSAAGSAERARRGGVRTGESAHRADRRDPHQLIAPETLDDFKRRMRLFCRDRLPSYKVPVHVEFTDADQFGARMKKKRDSATAPR